MCEKTALRMVLTRRYPACLLVLCRLSCFPRLEKVASLLVFLMNFLPLTQPFWSFAVRGMMYYRKALMLQSYLERMMTGGLLSENLKQCMILLIFSFFTNSIFCTLLDSEAGIPPNETTDTQGFHLSPESRAQADLKFTYVVTCQIYGKQKEEQKPEAADIALLMQR